MHFHNINKEGILFYLTMKLRDEHSFLTVSWKIFFSMFIIETIENLFQKILLAHTFHNNYILSMIYFVDWSPPKANVLTAADSKVEKEICTRTLPLGARHHQVQSQIFLRRFSLVFHSLDLIVYNHCFTKMELFLVNNLIKFIFPPTEGRLKQRLPGWVGRQRGRLTPGRALFQRDSNLQLWEINPCNVPSFSSYLRCGWSVFPRAIL